MYGKQDRKQIKSTLTREDARRKIEEQQQTLRRQKIEELVSKKRNVEEQGTTVVDQALYQKLQGIPQLVQNIKSNDPQVVLKATIEFRKLLSLERNPPIDEVIKAGVIPVFVSFLRMTDMPTLQFEAAWALTNIASGTSLHTEKVIQFGAVSVFIQLISMANSTDEVREQCVWALGNIAGDSPKCRNYVLECGGLQALLKLVIENPKVTILRNATWTISNLCRGKPQPELHMVQPALPILCQLLYHNDEEVLIDACWAISYLSDGANDRIQSVVDAQVVPKLVELLGYYSTSVQTPALRTLGNIVTGNDQQTSTVVGCGALQKLSALLHHSKKGIRKETCWTISNITAGNKEQIQAVVNADIFPILADILLKDDFDVKKEAAWAVSNATSGGTAEQVQYLVNKAQVIKPLVELLTIKDAKIVTVALEALENILAFGDKETQMTTAMSAGGEINPYVILIDEAGGIQKIEELQRHPLDEIYHRAAKIIAEYYGGIEENMASEDTTMAITSTTSNTNGVQQQQQQQQQQPQFGSIHLPEGGFKFN